jgi:hypothetical protein
VTGKMFNPGTVCVAYLDPGHWSACFGQSLVRLYIADSFGKQRIIPNGQELRNWCGAGGIVAGRNNVVASFLDKTDCEWLFWLDSDMGFEQDIVDRLIDAADEHRRPIVGALCFALRRATSVDARYAEHNIVVPTLYRFVETDDKAGFQSILDYEPAALNEVGATGSAAILIHRRALRKIRDAYADHWYDPVTHPMGSTFSEDLSFCVRAAACDMPIYVHTGVQTAHDKGGIFLDEQAYRAQAQIGGDGCLSSAPTTISPEPATSI